MFQRQRFEIEPVRGVVVGGDGFGVAVDHDGFIARRGQGIAGVAAAIVELDPLADAVGAAAKDDDLFGGTGTRFAFHIAHRGGFVGGIHVGGLGLELGGAGVDAFEDGVDAQVAAGAADLASSRPVSLARRASVKPIIFSLRSPSASSGRPLGAHLGLGVDDLADAGKEPGVEGGDGVDVVIGQAVAHGLGDDAQAVGGGLGQRFGDGGAVGVPCGRREWRFRQSR